jgi:hypothetical protein
MGERNTVHTSDITLLQLITGDKLQGIRKKDTYRKVYMG